MIAQVARHEALFDQAECSHLKKSVQLIVNGVEESDQRLKAQA